MKPLYVCFLFLLLVVVSASAQREFAPAGATWYYGFHDTALSIPIFQGYEEMSYDRDTMIDNIACKVLTRQRVGEVDNELVSYAESEKIIYQEGYQIFVRVGESFVKIYDFGLFSGETIVVDYPGCREEYRVDSVYFEEIDGENLKNMVVTKIDGYGEGVSLINEKFGEMSYYQFTGENSCIPDFGETLSFRCYEDDEFTHYQKDTIACDEYSNISQVVNLEKTGIAIFSNPVKDFVLLKNSSGEAYDLTVFDFDGHLMYQSFTVKEGSKEIDCAEWHPGTYVVQLKMGENRAFKKLLKAN